MSSTFIRPFQKWESVGFFLQPLKVLFVKYLLRNNSCHIPSSLHNLTTHLLSKHLFCISKSWTPRPPCVFGWQINFHFTTLYFFLCWSFCQKKRDLKDSIFSSTPLGISKKDNMNIGKLDKTELINTRRPPTVNILAFQPLSFFSILCSMVFQSLLLNFL